MKQKRKGKRRKKQMKTLKEFLEQKAAETKPKELEWGYCLPDCGECCVKMLHEKYRQEKIAEKLGVSAKSISEAFSPITGLEECPFLYGSSLCAVHHLEERNPDCSPFKCHVYSRIEKLASAGFNTPAELKKMWLSRKSNGYDRKQWLNDAESYVAYQHLKMVVTAPIRLLLPGKRDSS